MDPNSVGYIDDNRHYEKLTHEMEPALNVWFVIERCRGNIDTYVLSTGLSLRNIIAVSASEVCRFRSTEPIKSAVSKLLSMRSNPEAKVEVGHSMVLQDTCISGTMNTSHGSCHPLALVSSKMPLEETVECWEGERRSHNLLEQAAQAEAVVTNLQFPWAGTNYHTRSPAPTFPNIRDEQGCCRLNERHQ